MRDFFSAFILVFLACAFCACSDSLVGAADEDSRAGIFVDARDLQTYKTVEIGGNVWMAQNMNYFDASDSLYSRTSCYNDSAEYCEMQGRLYAWNVAMVACPEGWKIPSKSDFDSLIDAVGGFDHAVDSLFAQEFISAIGGGYHFLEYYNYFDEYAYFWTSDEVRANYARTVLLENGRSSVSYDETYEEFALSVRCVKTR
jgi:uncharacterized protein (TIGR02145 family)